MKKASADNHKNAVLVPILLHPNIIGETEVMASLLNSVKNVAAHNTTVLITGEIGTGKDLIAQLIHCESPRKNRPFVVINCAAIPETLIESELFGHEKGSFTGAGNNKSGKFEIADHGTIFLDEIGELPIKMQGKLLRVIQERNFERIGGLTPISVNVRIVAATNRDLKKEVAAGNFREDLLSRLNVYPIHISPLRDRVDDIPLLINYFRDTFNAKLGRSISNVDKAVSDAFIQYHWPTNVRELGNVMERIMTDKEVGSDSITIEDIPSEFRPVMPPEKVKRIMDNDENQMPEAESYRALCDWILKDENYLKNKQCRDHLKTKARQLGIWRTETGIKSILRGLINHTKTQPKLFLGINRNDMGEIFDLLFSLAPSLKKEKEDAVNLILSNWPTDIRCLAATNKRESSLEGNVFLETSQNDTDASLSAPVFTFRGKFDPEKGKYFQSEFFDVFGNEVTIKAKVWGMIGVTNTRVTVVPIADRNGTTISDSDISGYAALYR